MALRVAYGDAMTVAIVMAVMVESHEWQNSGFFILKNVRDRGWTDPSQPYPSFSSSAVWPAAVSSATNGGAGAGDAHNNHRRCSRAPRQETSRRRTQETDDRRTRPPHDARRRQCSGARRRRQTGLLNKEGKKSRHLRIVCFFSWAEGFFFFLFDTHFLGG